MRQAPPPELQGHRLQLTQGGGASPSPLMLRNSCAVEQKAAGQFPKTWNHDTVCVCVRVLKGKICLVNVLL